MKKAIHYLRNLGLKVDKNGIILSALPDGEKGLQLADMLQENTQHEDHCYTITDNNIEKIEY